MLVYNIHYPITPIIHDNTHKQIYINCTIYTFRVITCYAKEA